MTGWDIVKIVGRDFNSVYKDAIIFGTLEPGLAETKVSGPAPGKENYV